MTRRKRNSTASNAKRRRSEAGKIGHLQSNYSGPSFSDLPSIILVNILLRLCVKRILACKCVCKTWYDLISNPEFAKIHLDRAEVCPLVRTSGFTVLSRMIYLVQPELNGFEGKRKKRKDFDELESEYYEFEPKSKIKLDAKLKLPLRNLQMINPEGDAERNNHMKLNMKNHKYRIVNSCNGLLLLSNNLSDNDPVIVCNPVTGEFINLPEVRTANDSCLLIDCGLGYSPVTEQYKVIRMFHRWVGRDSWVGRDRVMVAEVNILGTDSWKDLQYFADTYRKKYTTYLNGCLYWLSLYMPYSVICFDIEKECFESISPPHVFDYFVDDRVTMGVLGGELCITEFFESVNVWAMKDDGKEKTWSQIFSFYFDYMDRWPYGSYQPIKYMDDGALLMFHPRKRAFICKHPYKHGFGYWKVRGLDSKVEAIAHIPSLVLLKHALSGHKKEVLNISSRCGNLKLYKETKGVSLAPECRLAEIDTDDDRNFSDYGDMESGSE